MENNPHLPTPHFNNCQHLATHSEDECFSEHQQGPTWIRITGDLFKMRIWGSRSPRPADSEMSHCRVQRCAHPTGFPADSQVHSGWRTRASEKPVRVDRLPVLMEYLRALLSDCHSQDHQVHRVKQTESQAPNLRPKWHGRFTSPSALRRLHVVTHQLRRRPVASVLRKPFVNWSFDC